MVDLANESITGLLSDLKAGRAGAAANLINAVYPELRRLAGSSLRQERRGHTLQPTALVNEAFLCLAGQSVDWRDRIHFFGVAANVMRQVLIQYARAHQAQKRGGGAVREPLDEESLMTDAQSKEVLALDEALEQLSKIDERQSRIVELRYFTGLSVEDLAKDGKTGLEPGAGLVASRNFREFHDPI